LGDFAPIRRTPSIGIGIEHKPVRHRIFSEISPDNLASGVDAKSGGCERSRKLEVLRGTVRIEPGGSIVV
jgi:hypothetical protein